MMDNKLKTMVNNAIIAALIIVLNAFNPIGFGPIQFRLSEALSVIPFYNKKYMSGVLIGVFIANLFSPLNIIDSIAGVTVGVVSYTLASKINNQLIKNLVFSSVSGIIIGFMLYKMLNIPFTITAISIAISTIVSTSIGTWIIEKYLKKLILE